MRPPRVLISLSNAPEGERWVRELSRRGWSVKAGPRDALGGPEVEPEECDAWVIESGAALQALLARAQAARTPPAVLIVSAFGSVADAVEAMRHGAHDFLLEPLEVAQLELALRRALESRELRAENARLRRSVGEGAELGLFASRDERVLAIVEQVECVADTRANVLITGESGTGKTLLARALHQRSSRAAGPFVEVNCGALPAALLESELFGHAKGAFTGALRDKPGRFEAADDGTLFLDEIGAASPELQVKLLRVLQDRTFERLGETHTRSADVRWVAATNEELERAVREGRFREDLYWRLAVVTLHLPPLRERPRDVLFLAERFCARFAGEYGRSGLELSAPAQALLAAHAWPGNVRELENVIERAVLFSRGASLGAEDLPVALRSARCAPSPGSQLVATLPLKRALEAPERELILRALEQCGGSRSRASALLEVNRTTLFNKMRKYDLLDFPQCGEPRSPLPGQSPHQAAP